MSLSSHTVLVKTLYRQLLKETYHWCSNREYWFYNARRIRKDFDKHSKLTDLGQIAQAVKKGQTWLDENSHPDPYNLPHMPGGMSFQRNAKSSDWGGKEAPDHGWGWDYEGHDEWVAACERSAHGEEHHEEHHNDGHGKDAGHGKAHH